MSLARPTHRSPLRPAVQRGLVATLAVLALGGPLLSGCAPLLIGGAALGGAFVATDRRTSGTQLDDQTIELKAGSKIREVVGAREHINVNSYNRTVLLTGEVYNDGDRAAVEQAIRKVEGVKDVFNETVVGWPSSFGERSKDELLRSKVAARLLNAKELSANIFTVVCERNVVYLMGRVTEREATIATDLARDVEGVEKVVRVLEIISPDQVPGNGKTKL